MFRFTESSKKHGITEEQMLEVRASQLTVATEMDASERGNTRVMLVGYTMDGVMLEVGVELADDADIYFHAKAATAHWRKEAGL